MRTRAAIVLGLVLLDLAAFNWLGRVDHHVQDWLLRQHAAGRTPDLGIVLLNIDERSLAAMEDDFGGFPWPRSVYAELVEKLQAQKPAAIVFDLFFADPSKEHPDLDAYLCDAFAAAPEAYAAMSWLEGADESRGLDLDRYGAALGFTRSPQAAAGAHLPLLLPFQRIAETGRIGLVNFLPDDDGVGRRYRLWLEHRGWKAPSLPARVALGLGWKLPAGDDFEINWRGLPQARPQVSFSDVLLDLERAQPQRAAEEFRGKVVVVGVTAGGLNDLHPTPLSHQQTGPEILAAALETIKHGDGLHRLPYTGALAFGFLPLILLALASMRGAGPLPLGLVLAVYSALLPAGAYLALNARLLLPVAPPLGALWVAYLALAVREYLHQRRERVHAVRVFSRFVHPRVVETLMDSRRELLDGGGTSRELTVLFSDIRGFTTLSETRTPEAVVSLLNRYFSRQVEVVFKYGGTVDKFIGDAIMAFWGAPLADPGQAEHAVRAALEMAQVAGEFAREVAAEGVSFDIGIGIHSGPAVVGFIGSHNKTDYTAIGDTVNLASRIEGLTKGVARVLVSAQTRERCGGAIGFADRGEFKAKGREQLVRLFEPVLKGEGDS